MFLSIIAKFNVFISLEFVWNLKQNDVVSLLIVLYLKPQYSFRFQFPRTIRETAYVALLPLPPSPLPHPLLVIGKSWELP